MRKRFTEELTKIIKNIIYKIDDSLLLLYKIIFCFIRIFYFLITLNRLKI